MFSDDRKVEIASKAKVELTGQPVPLFFGLCDAIFEVGGVLRRKFITPIIYRLIFT